MSRWRLIVLAALVAAPFLFLVGYGSYMLWLSGWGFWAWWPMAACFALAYLLGWYWQRQRRLLPHVDFTPPLRWTDRDKQAWQLVEARAKAAEKFNPDRFTSLELYTETAQEMALELARFYHPGAEDPIGSLTIPEMLTVVEMAAHDLNEMVARYIPAGHLLTVNNWKTARKAADWYQTATNMYWVVASIFSPLNTGVRYLASKAGMSLPFQKLQANILVWFYTAFVHRLGTYLIDLNSGRLRVGAGRYRQLLEQYGPAPAALPSPDGDAEGPPPAREVTITLLGQVKAGKSSLVNALLGEQRAGTSVLPMTDEVTRYETSPEGIGSRLVLLDTVGYGHEGPRKDKLAATHDAARQSDVLFLVLHARNPARQADLEQLKELREWFASQPDLKLPPILAVLTHIDLLSPAMEWQPPYDWQNPKKPKEKQIAAAAEAVREQLGEYLVGVVPVCAQEGKVYGVQEWLMPALAHLLDEARAVALLRVLRAEADTGKVRRIFQQLIAGGGEALKVLWGAAKKL
jgi:predicted GTPase